MTNELPKSTPLLRSERGQAWCVAMRDPHALLSGIMRVVHPDQYKATRAVHKAIQSTENEGLLEAWGAVGFHATSIICNRETPLHRDPLTNFRCYDILSSIGHYTGARMSFPGLNAQIPNEPGTVVAVMGKTVWHGVEKAMGDRVCHAYYAREALFRRNLVRFPAWMEQAKYDKDVGSVRGALRCLPLPYE